MLVSTPLAVVVRSLACGFGRHSGKGLSLCDGEAAACGLLRECLVEIGMALLEACGVESLAQNGSPTDDVLSGFQFFDVAV